MSHPEIRSTPKRSLLSSNLAREHNQSNQLGDQTSLPQQHTFFNIHEIINNNNNNNNDEIILDHPEPQLLASSVGKDINGKLIPSSSTISLLSLGQDSQYSQQQQLQQSQNQQNQAPILIRQNSNNRSYLNLQRLQQYQRISQSENLPTINSINSEYISIPNSPSLDPTSVGNSPSRFWLSSQTPPYKIKPIYQYVTHRNPTTNNSTTTLNNIQGDKSPQLNPVQTPLEDPPMTPLFLNSQTRMDYFGQLTEQVEEEEHENENENNVDNDEILEMEKVN
ncbi:hypothetical protein KGF54_003349 [Candida jiufengensis]|uniref:uncharacterized protein n=1 Tax=Candida jiufengensis TaxID=497108 RepID=UPI002224B9B8|nr:uncharacterized protein KGF54_003349 [Candida jiufengensis]KAI5952482.1 hypothetical protein KGF54_003349 [Candida jiufengensis]